MTERQSNIWHIPEGWEVKKLKDVITNAGDYGANAPAKPYIEGDTRYIRITDIDDYGNLIPDDKVSIDESVAQNYLLEDNDMLFARTGDTVGKSLLYKSTMGKAAYAGYLIKFSFDRTKIFPEYFNAIAKSDIFEAFKNSMKRVGAKPNINSREYGTFTFPLPINLQEQKNIAAILSKVDESIATVQASISAAERLKKSLIQNLLTGRMKPDGTLRKEDEFYVDEKFGKVPKGWVVKKVSEIAENLDNLRKPIKSIDRDKIKGKIPYYGAAGIVDYINDYLFDGTYLLFGEDGENLLSRKVPQAFIVKGKFWVNNHAHILRVYDNYDINLIVMILEAKKYDNIVYGSAQPKINKSDLCKIKIMIPTKLEEQNQISNSISKIGQEIINKQNKIAVLERLKKSLMQNLLTGRMRVK